MRLTSRAVKSPLRLPAILALLGCALGLAFAFSSTADYASHLDRQLHDLHCSFVPGMSTEGNNQACRAAMYSPYSAVMKESYWGGIPISLFALGAFAGLAGFAAYLLGAGQRASRRAVGTFALLSVTPLAVSILMLVISLTRLGALCKTCTGIYISSALLAAAGIWAYLASHRVARPAGSWVIALLWPLLLGVVTLIPTAVYAASVPDQTAYLEKCGTLPHPEDKQKALLKIRTQNPKRAALVFEDPLCPTCKAFHERLVIENIFEQLDVTLSLFPLDNECNWMLDQAMHPGACTLSKAVICGGPDARTVLEWSYENQERLADLGKAGKTQLRAAIRERFGTALDNCIDAKTTVKKLNDQLHFAAENSILVSTPQLYLGTQRVCDEDTDIGLRFTLSRLAPEVLK